MARSGADLRPIALITAHARAPQDADLPPPQRRSARGASAAIVDWDDADLDWSQFALGCSVPWDYSVRGEFLHWLDRAALAAHVLNPPTVIRWNLDKHYGRVAARGGTHRAHPLHRARR
jgi:hypothetical protein